ncbi:MAG TPA: twin-arginine translocase subunit TatC, partial [Burkholderiales bacterium]|nr:twin-arginine translocase subunit TatC [Burkholderiales bacterium]
MRALVAMLVLFVGLFIWPGSGPIYDLLAQPLMQALPEGAKMIATGVITPFLVPMKVTALVAFMIALPYVLYQAWAFVAPGLYEHEKKLALPIVVAGTVLFLIGVAFCYFFVFGTVFRFINNFAPKSITPAPDIEAYFSFVITMFLAFGVTFEIPIVVIILVRAGVVSVQKLKDARPYFIVGAFVVAAIVTPPDVLSQFMLA